MNNTQKEQWFEQISEQQNNQIEIRPWLNQTGNQIIELTLPCGCTQADHYLSRKCDNCTTAFNKPCLGNVCQHFSWCSTHKHYETDQQHFCTKSFD